MSSERITGFSKEDRESLKPVASWLNEELGTGASVWRKDITDAIRMFPKPVCVDLDGTLVGDQGDRENVHPDAVSAMRRAGEIGSVFIVTNGLVSIDYLRRLGLAGDRTVLITRQNYGPLPNLDLPPEAEESLRQYIARQRGLGREFRESDFKLEDTAQKHLAPLFMQDEPVPLIDNAFYATWHNPGIWGIAVKSWPYGGDERTYRFLSGEVLRLKTLSEVMELVDNFYVDSSPVRGLIPLPYPGILSLSEADSTQLTTEDKYRKIALGINDILRAVGYGTIIGFSTYEYSLRITYFNSVLDGVISRVEFKTDREVWNALIAESLFRRDQGESINPIHLTYGRYKEGQLVEYGYDMHHEEAGGWVLKHNPGVRYVNVVEAFEILFADILP